MKKSKSMKTIKMMEDSEESNVKASGFANLKNSKVMKCSE